MSLFGRAGQFDDPVDENTEKQRLGLQEELELARAGFSSPHDASRLSAASRATLGFTPSATLARAASADRGAGDAATSYLSMLSAGTATDPSAASPYASVYQRQAAAAYRPYTLAHHAQTPAATAATAAYAGLQAQDAATANLYRRYYAPPASTPEAAAAAAQYHAHYGAASPHSYYTSHQQSADLSQQALLDRYVIKPSDQSAKQQPQQQPSPVAFNVQQKTPASPTTPSSAAQQQQQQQQETPTQSKKAPSDSDAKKGLGSTPRGTSRTGSRVGTPRSAGRPAGVSPVSIQSGNLSGVPEKPDTIQTTDGEERKWYSGCVPLGLAEDKYWLSELQVYLRSNFAEAFGATESDIAAPMHGRNKPIALGQVGIRCMHCRNDPPSERGQQATSYPSLISGIYNSVQQMLRLHFDCCLSMPPEVRSKIEQLKVSSSARGGRKQYWIDSAKRLGLVDTQHGIHFGRDPYGPLPPLSGPSVEKKERKPRKSQEKSKKKPKEEPIAKKEDEKKEGAEEDEPAPVDLPQVETYPLVEPEDRDLISDYLYLTLEQMQPCNLMEADKVGCYKARKVGFPGLACKHCVGQAGCGRYFPASEASLSQTTTSQTIMNHVRNCRRCPVDIRENLELMKRARMGPDGKRADKPKHGGRKVFFRRLWCRIQRIPMTDEEAGRGSGSGKKKRGGSGRKKQATTKKAKKKSTVTASEDTEGKDDEMTSEETETEDDESSEDEDDLDLSSKSKKPRKKQPVVFNGCVRLTKTDDARWLSEMQCYARSELVEVFSLGKDDSLDGYNGRKDPESGQVGIRCVFCKTLPEGERPLGCVAFPESLSQIHTKVTDLIRLHFPSCPGMSDDIKTTFRSLRGFGAKADDDAQQYWTDAARDIGLSDLPPSSLGKSWGITFRKDPLQPSPADDLDRESAGAEVFKTSRSSLVRPEDRGMCTDHVMLLLRQVKPCQFKKSDRRGAPGARGRDRVIGFPGLCCRYCSPKTTVGRYFPLSAKNLTDNTANSIQAHISSCNRVPEEIKSSLAYLMHRSTLQKAELSGSWKKSFFRQIWDRLHVERAWSTQEGGKEDDTVVTSSSDDDQKLEDESQALDSDEEDLGEAMGALIKAAAIWLSDQENSSDSRSRAIRGRVLPGQKRALSGASSATKELPSGESMVDTPPGDNSGRSRSRGASGSVSSSKRRRVHF